MLGATVLLLFHGLPSCKCTALSIRSVVEIRWQERMVISFLEAAAVFVCSAYRVEQGWQPWMCVVGPEQGAELGAGLGIGLVNVNHSSGWQLWMRGKVRCGGERGSRTALVF